MIYLESAWLSAIALNILLVFFAHRLPLLTKLGWFHAGALGTILWACIGWQAWMSVAIYLLFGSLVTKIGFKYKDTQGLAEARGGRRGPENVWGSAATGALLALLFKSLNGIGAELILVCFAASFAAKLADTFGSEIGKRWGRRTYLITSLSRVAPGTDGAISVEGTFASFLGSLIMSSVMSFLSLISWGIPFLIVLISGIFATLLESLLGALVQNKFNWLTNEVVNFLQTTISAIIAMCLFLVLRS